jgi:hypothetical protein
MSVRGATNDRSACRSDPAVVGLRPDQGLLGGLVGGFVGCLVVTGLAGTTSNGELPALYSPEQLDSTAVPVAVVAAVLALVSPYAIGFASLGWAVGAVLAAVAAPRTGQAVYVLPLAAHVLAAALVVCLARWRAAVLR